MSRKRVLILLGGVWHDFEGFSRAMKSLLEAAGYSVDDTYDLDSLTRLSKERCDLVLSYTCFSERREGSSDAGPEGLTDAQINALAAWIRGGGALLAAHSATVVGESSPLLGELLGGTFVSHPPPFTFTVYPLFQEHQITAGSGAFTVHDEFYMEKHNASVDVHMVAIDRGVAYPMVWSKDEGRGRVAHVALGHSQEVWNLAPYQRLMRQTMAWLTADANKD